VQGENACVNVCDIEVTGTTVTFLHDTGVWHFIRQGHFRWDFNLHNSFLFKHHYAKQWARCK